MTKEQQLSVIQAPVPGQPGMVTTAVVSTREEAKGIAEILMDYIQARQGMPRDCANERIEKSIN